MQEKGTISIHTENIFPIIKKFLYSDNEIFLRELVSNAVDAVQKLRRLSSLGQYSGDMLSARVQVSVSKENKTITISDDGLGMTAEEIKKYINQVAFSGATEFMDKFKEAADANEIIGRFGLGFYSAFMVADKVEIDTLSYREGETAAHWVCDGSTTFEISEGTRTKVGTDIILHINEDSLEFLEEQRLRFILDKYCKFLPVPVQFGTRAMQEADGEDEEGKPKYNKVEVDNIINNTAPLWTKQPSELQDEDYLAFYRELYPYSTEPPLFWIHLNVDYPFNLTGVLYFPKLKNDFDLQNNKIKLFSRQVFITDEVKEIVPQFLTLLHGVIDSPDIPLNVSRSFLQADSNVKKISSYITRKVAEKLAGIFKNDRKAFEEKWPDLGLFVKYGIVSDDKFFEKAKDFTLLGNTAGAYFTLDEYRDKVALLQTDKDNTLVYLYTNDLAKQDSFIRAANKKDYDVLLLNSPIDTHFISFLERSLDGINLKRVDADVVDKLIVKDEAIPHVLTDEQAQNVKDIFERAIQRPQMHVELEGLTPEDLPVTITMDELFRRMKEMSKISGEMNSFGPIPESYKVSVNANHKLIDRILNTEDAAQQSQLARQAFDLALLAQGMLTGPELTDFVNRSVAFI